MKIKTKDLAYDLVVKLPRSKHKNPRKPNFFLKRLIKILSESDLKKADFSYEEVNMEQVKNKPCLILMNHSSFIDLEIAEKLWYPKPLQIVCTSDGFVGKEALMRAIGCIPTQKFVTDLNLLKDMKYALKTLKSSVLMYPEASYSFDGTATPLPDSLGKCVKLLGVPLVMITTKGAFSRDPLYNMLQVRKVPVSAKMECLLTPEEIEKMSAEEINEMLSKVFSFDYFKWQQEEMIEIAEEFRADGLNRVLYKCPHCMTEGKMEGSGTKLTCHSCGASYELDEFGNLVAENVESKFSHIPDWFKWERECVRNELIDGTYKLEEDVEIKMMVDKKAIYNVGEGKLVHDCKGFWLTGCDGKLEYKQSPQSSYSLYSDYYWYELGDMICIGDMKTLYYCFPKSGNDVVAKTRIAQEELYKLDRKNKGF